MNNIKKLGVTELSKRELIEYDGGILAILFSAIVASGVVIRGGVDIGRELYRSTH